MATSSNIVIKKQITKRHKGIPVVSLKEVKTDKTSIAIEKAIRNLKKTGVQHFQVIDKDNNVKTLYFKTINDKNYLKKVVGIE